MDRFICRRCGQRILLDRGDGICEACRRNPDTPRARTTDPSTSHEAAASVRGVSPAQLRVKMLITFYPASTDEELYGLWQRVRTHGLGDLPGDWGTISEPGLRTRRSELVARGEVEAVPGQRGTTRAGRSCHVWRVVPGGKSA